MTFNLILLLISPIPWVLPRHLLWLSCHTGQVWRGGGNLMSRHTPSCTEARVRAHARTHTRSHKWWKTSWNKTTGSRSDFTGYTRSCETEVEIQIGLTRNVHGLLNPSLEITWSSQVFKSMKIVNIQYDQNITIQTFHHRRAPLFLL